TWAATCSTCCTSSTSRRSVRSDRARMTLRGGAPSRRPLRIHGRRWSVVQQAESEFTLDTAAELAAAEGGGAAIRGRSPWSLAWRRLRRNYFAFASLALFLLIVAACIAAPLYAHHVAHTGQYDQHVLDKVTVNGKKVDVVSQGGVINGKLVAS